jgi:hypothetical protein
MEDEIMTGFDTFDWTIVDDYIMDSAMRKKHVVFSVFIHWPGQALSLPSHLTGVPTIPTEEGPTPQFDHPDMITAYQQYIAALANRYDNDPRVAVIHTSLLGFWGTCA